MADVTITVQDLSSLGVTPSYTGSLSLANTYLVRNDGRVFVHLKKSGAGDCTATIATPATIDGLAVADRTVTVVATTGDKMIGPFAPTVYNDAVGDVRITFSEITGLVIGAMRM